MGVKLTKEQQEHIKSYFSHFEDRINEYIDNPNKPNECIDLGIVKDETEACMKATEMMWEKYPCLPKAVIYASIFSPDPEDYGPEDGEPTFIYTIIHKTKKGEKHEKWVVIFNKGGIQCSNCQHCNYENENGGMYHVETLCKRHNKMVEFYNPFCEDYVMQKNYFYTDKTTKEENPYLDR